MAGTIFINTQLMSVSIIGSAMPWQIGQLCYRPTIGRQYQPIRPVCHRTASDVDSSTIYIKLLGSG